MTEAIPLLSDYVNDKQYFQGFEFIYPDIPEDQMLLHLNYRNTRKGIECLFKGCDMPLWATDFEFLRAIDFDKSRRFTRLLVEYTCGEHTGIYEAIPLKDTSLYFEDD